WDHSPQLELLVWAGPLLIIIAVGAISWIGTHMLDPYRPIDRIAARKPIPADATPLEVDVVSLRWKWLFLYPQYGVASVNELAAPVDRPIRFKLTGDTMMDSFFVPALAGQIYTMPGMQTILHAVIDQPGEYKGFSANFSGSGFTDMRFAFRAMSPADFDRWVAKAHAAGGDLDLAAYDRLRQPSRAEPVHYYAAFDADLYPRILNLCTAPGEVCKDRMTSHGHEEMQNMQGSAGHDSATMSMPMSRTMRSSSGAATAPAAH
ncbi:MAG: ubiquinol oxidase subunit II, partial [Rhodanobacteraceae bacterium]